jgi:hypothetical protein
MPKNSQHRWSTRLAWLAIFLLPWQTRWIIQAVPLMPGQTSEYGTISLYATMIVAFACGLFFWHQHKHHRHAHHLHWLVLWLVWLAVVAIWSSSPIVSWYYLIITLGAIVYYLIARAVSPLVIVSSLVAAGCLQALLALWQWSVSYVYPNTWLGLAEHNPSVLGQSVIVTAAGRLLRAYGSFPHPNILAGFLVVSLMSLTIWYWLDKKRDVVSHTALFMGAKALMFLGLFVTFSRAGLLALIVWQVCTLGLSVWRRQWKLFQTLICSLALFAVMLFASNLCTQGLVLQRLHSNDRLEVISQTERLASWNEAAKMLDFPHLLMGVGPGAYVWAEAEHFPGRQNFQYQPAHMVYLLALAELGLIGLWLLIVVMTNCTVWPKKGTEGRTLAISWLLTLGTLGLFDHWLWSSYSGLTILWLSLGLISVLATHKTTSKST